MSESGLPPSPLEELDASASSPAGPSETSEVETLTGFNLTIVPRWSADELKL